MDDEKKDEKLEALAALMGDSEDTAASPAEDILDETVETEEVAAPVEEEKETKDLAEYEEIEDEARIPLKPGMKYEEQVPPPPGFKKAWKTSGLTELHDMDYDVDKKVAVALDEKDCWCVIVKRGLDYPTMAKVVMSEDLDKWLAGLE